MAASPWEQMDARPRTSMRTLTQADLPTNPGVYVLYRRGRRMYVGKAGSLRERVWKSHSSRSQSLSNSAMRRNVAEYLGYGTPADIKAGVVRLTDEQLTSVRDWLDGCKLAWVVCRSEKAAVDLERRLQSEFRPTLTKR